MPGDDPKPTVPPAEAPCAPGTSHQDAAADNQPPAMDAAAVHRVAKLCKIAVPDDRVATLGAQLSGVLGYIDRLRELDLDGVEPMAHVGDRTATLADDVPTGTLDPAVLERLTDHLEIFPGSVDSDGNQSPPQRYLRVPKVLGNGDGGGA